MGKEWFAACPKGLEELLADELIALGGESVRQTVAGVYAEGELAFAYRACLWSRFANRILMPLKKHPVNDADDLYEAVVSIPWEAHFESRNTLAVDFTGTNDAIRHSKFGAQQVKDAIVDRFQQQCNERPSVDLQCPDARINVRLSKGQANISFDMSGDSLHKRGYRVAMVPAPLKENLAAALLVRAGWPALADSDSHGLIDPCCGSGTLLIEGAMMAADMAPGLLRERFGFEGWSQHDNGLWQSIREEALERCQTRLDKPMPEIRGYDKDTRAVEAAQENIAYAGLDKWVRVMAKPLAAFKRPSHRTLTNGLVITNPPYGERWGEIEELKPLYHTLGDVVKRECPGWRLAVISGNAELTSELRLRADKKYQLFNGTIPAQLSLFQLRTPEQTEQSKRMAAEKPLSDGAAMFANRLKKNHRKLSSWLKQNGITCYRLYDADMPEYAVAVDIYGEAIHVQEYAPPANIDTEQANRHLSEVKEALKSLFPASSRQLFFKERRKQKGDNQYRKGGQQQGTKGSKPAKDSPYKNFKQPQTNSSEPRRGVMTVSEATTGGAVDSAMDSAAKFEINLVDYLDSGLFLDHRPVRRMIAKMAKGKRFLNLFCYTGTATVHAVLGGAKSSLSVDMSRTYLDWAERNFAMNQVDVWRHKVLRADCLSWLAERQGEFDLIFLDPPTFSNSKNMSEILDIQRDHSRLVEDAMAILHPEGTLIFSNNFKKFILDEALHTQFRIEEITDQTFDPDFSRNRNMHHCWLIRHHG